MRMFILFDGLVIPLAFHLRQDGHQGNTSHWRLCHFVTTIVMIIPHEPRRHHPIVYVLINTRACSEEDEDAGHDETE